MVDITKLNTMDQFANFLLQKQNSDVSYYQNTCPNDDDYDQEESD